MTVTVGTNPTGRLSNNTTAGRSITSAWPRTNPANLPNIVTVFDGDTKHDVRVQADLRGGDELRPLGMAFAWVHRSESQDREKPLPSMSAEYLAGIAERALGQL